MIHNHLFNLLNNQRKWQDQKYNFKYKVSLIFYLSGLWRRIFKLTFQSLPVSQGPEEAGSRPLSPLAGNTAPTHTSAWPDHWARRAAAAWGRVAGGPGIRRPRFRALSSSASWQVALSLPLRSVSSRPACHMSAPFLPWQGLREKKLGHVRDTSNFRWKTPKQLRAEGESEAFLAALKQHGPVYL